MDNSLAPHARPKLEAGLHALEAELMDGIEGAAGRSMYAVGHRLNSGASARACLC